MSPEKNLTKSNNQVEKEASVVKNFNKFFIFASISKIEITQNDSNYDHLNANSLTEDLTGFFPMTTSMTRGLCLELESLDANWYITSYSIHRSGSCKFNIN